MDAQNPFFEVHAAVLQAALPDLASGGWTQATLDAACTKAGVDAGMCGLAFPRGVESLIVAFFDAQDAQMLAALGAPDDKKIRERIYHGVATRLNIDTPHREAVRSALGWLAHPKRHVLAAQILFKTAHHIWRWAGDTATDYNYYSKRLILSGVIATTTAYWLRDESADYADTHAFLHRRIENVLQFEKAKADVRQFFDKLSRGQSAA